MSRHFTLAFIALTTVGFVSVEASTPAWRAQWIWLPEGDDAEMLLARRSFKLAEIPERAVVLITASSRYELYVNGHFVRRGPARSASHHQSFDRVDVTDTLRVGENVLAVRVHFQREDVSYYGPSRAGLLAQLDWTPDSRVPAIQTDGSWRVHADASWRKEAPKMARFHLEVCDRVDLRDRIDGWNEPVFDDDWPRARVLKREVGWPSPQANDRPTHLIPPWTSLVARDIPYLTETVINASEPARVGTITLPGGGEDLRSENWIDAPVIGEIPVPQRTETPAQLPITVAAAQPGKCRAVVVDFDEVRNGRPFVDISAPAGTVIDVVSAPYLIGDNIPSPIVFSDYVDRIVLSGKRERWQAFYAKPVRLLAVVFRELLGEAKLFQAGIVREEYPFEENGYFESPDFPELESLWKASAKTVRVCTTDAYTDNYRERRQYAQTAYYACLGNYPVFGDHALQRRYLVQIADEQLANGIMPAYAPRHGDDFMVILDSNCFWVRGLHQYLLYSGDHETVRELLPAARKLLELLDGFTNADGLIDSPPYPYWLDHAVNDRRGANFCFNGHYLGAVEDLAQVLEWLGESDVKVYRSRAKRIRSALGERLWDPQERLFADALVDGKRSDQFSEHANAMALALRIGSDAQIRAVAERLTANEPHDLIRRESGITMVTPAMSYFLHAGFAEAGYADESWNMAWSRFSHMLGPESNGTLWEEWWLDATGRSGRLRPVPSGRSDAQTESAFFPGLFSRYILGIEPTEPGLREVVLRYYDSSRLRRRHGAIPTLSGLLEVAWDVTPAEFGITLNTPTATTVKIDLASLGSPSLQDITVNGRAASDDQLRDGFLVIGAGESSLRIKRP